MDKNKIRSFFDDAASHWDKDAVNSPEIIETILKSAGCRPGARVLDVACGTGVMIPYYLKHRASQITAIDLSPEMAARARAKFPQPTVSIVSGDVMDFPFPSQFDCIMVYNAFPHFPQPDALIQHLAGLLAPGGTLTVAHGMSKAQIDALHSGSPQEVSIPLMELPELSLLFARYLSVTVSISDDRMYQVSGTRI